jgi:signal transduction histidine kinase
MLWSGESLTNGCGPTGELLGTRQWIEELDTRLQLVTRLLHLDREATAIRAQWTRNTNLVLTLTGGFGLLAALAIPVFFRIRESRRLREMRNSISGDLHDEIGSNLGSIQVLAGLLKSEHPATHEEASTIERVAAETVNSVRDIVWHLRPQTRETAHTIEHLRDTAAILLEPASCSLQTDIRGDDLLLDHRERRDLMLFFREVLHNISRHAKASRVDIRLGETDGMFHLSIADDGVGIPNRVQTQPGFFRALKERAKRLDGTLEFQSGVGKGTVVTLHFPSRTTFRTRVSRLLTRS